MKRMPARSVTALAGLGLCLAILAGCGDDARQVQPAANDGQDPAAEDDRTCTYEGKVYRDQEEFTDDCNTCRCNPEGSTGVGCSMIDCSALPPVDDPPDTPPPASCPTGPGFLNDGGPGYFSPDPRCPCEQPQIATGCNIEGAQCTYLRVHCPWQIVEYQYEHDVLVCEQGAWVWDGQDCYDCCRPPPSACEAGCGSGQYCLVMHCGVPEDLCEAPPPECRPRPAGCTDCTCLVNQLGPAGTDVCAGATPLCSVSDAGFDVACPAA